MSKARENQVGFSKYNEWKENAERTKGSVISNEMEKIEGVIDNVITELAAS